MATILAVVYVYLEKPGSFRPSEGHHPLHRGQKDQTRAAPQTPLVKGSVRLFEGLARTACRGCRRR